MSSNLKYISLLAAGAMLLVQCADYNKKLHSDIDKLERRLEKDPNDADAKQKLLKGARDGNPGKAIQYMIALSKQTVLDEEFRKTRAQLLASRISDKDEFVSRGAAESIVNIIEPSVIEILPALEDVVTRLPDTDAAIFCVEAIGKFGADARSSVPLIGGYLVRHMDAENSAMSKIAARALKNIGGPEVPNALREGISSKNKGVASTCRKLLEEISN
jgi:HEAT repeat protein